MTAYLCIMVIPANTMYC